VDPRESSRALQARIALGESMVDPAVIDRMFKLMDAKGARVSLAELLLQFGHIDESQFKKLLSLYRAARRGPETGEDSQLFGEALVDRGLATAEEVTVALKTQAELASKGIFKNLGEILVEQGALSEDQVKGLIEEQDQAIMVCPCCQERYNVLRGWEGKAKCPTDSALLEVAEQGTRIGVAATLGAGGGEPDSPIGMEAGGCKIVELLGKGTMGAVYKAKHVGLNRYVAVKMLPTISNNPDLVKRLLFEARAVAKLEHPNIVQVYDVGFQRGYFFMVMQLLKGQTLEERLVEMGMIPRDAALEIAEDIARGLGAAHEKGIIHRDLKPANVIITEDGKARLTDFGLAQDADNREEETGLIVGTPYYMSPEQWLGHKADERSDLYSLGIILYHMLTGKRPVQGETVNELMHQHLKVTPISPRTHDPTLPEGLCAVVRKLIAKPPRKRYPGVPEFLSDLAKAKRGEDPDALAEFGAVVKCGFCETMNPAGERKCKVCSEPLQAAGGPIEIVARADEFKCPGCGELNRRGSRSCRGCRKPFCVKCRQRLVVLKGYCHQCMSSLKR
jgi:predicted Ser/Thr protein kinase